MQRPTEINFDSNISDGNIPQIMRLRIKDTSPQEIHHRPGGSHRVLYLAFGSNLDPEQMIDRCSSAQAEYRAIVQGRKLGYGSRHHVATLLEIESATAAAVIYSLTADDLRKLDMFEGFKYQPKSIYARRAVKLSNGDTVMTYLLKDPPDGSMQPKEHYFRRIERGLNHWSFFEHRELHLKHGFTKQDNQ